MSDQFTEHQRQTLERMAELFTAPESDSEELDKVYLQIIADQLIQLTDAGFQREGRGIVLLDVPRRALPDRRDALVQAYYLSQAKAQSSGLTWSEPAIVQALQTYNPHIEILVCLTHAPKAGLYRIKRLTEAAQNHTRTDPNRPEDGASAVNVRISRIRK